MAIERIKTKQYTSYIGDSRITRASLVIKVTDELTDSLPVIPLSISLKNYNTSPIKNNSGYYCFIDLTELQYELYASSGEKYSGWYFDVTKSVDLTILDPLSPVIPIVFKPTPAYPFPKNITLVRGIVVDDVPIVGAVVKIDGTTLNTVTTINGEFALYITEYTQAEILVKISKNGLEKVITVQLVEGKLSNVGRISFPV